jgi:hypothetical protein
LSAPSTASYLKSLIRAVLCIWRKQALSLIDLPDQTLSMIEMAMLRQPLGLAFRA